MISSLQEVGTEIKESLKTLRARYGEPVMSEHAFRLTDCGFSSGELWDMFTGQYLTLDASNKPRMPAQLAYPHMFCWAATGADLIDVIDLVDRDDEDIFDSIVDTLNDRLNLYLFKVPSNHTRAALYILPVSKIWATWIKPIAEGKLAGA